MVDIKYKLYQIDSETLSKVQYFTDSNLESVVDPVEIPTAFRANEDLVELNYFTLDGVLLKTVNNYREYSILSGNKLDGIEGSSELSIDPLEDYKKYNDGVSEVKAVYNFLRNSYRTNNENQVFYIESISTDRREVRIISRKLNATKVKEITDSLVDKINESVYSLDLHLRTGSNTYSTCINIKSEAFRGTNAVVLRLSEALPTELKKSNTVSIVEKVANSVAYEINTEVPTVTPKVPTLRGANFNVELETQSTEPSEYLNYDELFSFPTTNTNKEINSLYKEKGAALGIDYSDFGNFINFSSAEERLLNFKYKVALLDNYQIQLDLFEDPGFGYSGPGAKGSKEYFENLINGLTSNFDHYERHLYYESGSTSWPKETTTTRPYVNSPASSVETTLWYTELLQEAILYDAKNVDILTNTIPSYLKEDSSNRPYELFIHMIAQHFDNLWVYTDAVSKKYENDNRLDKGVSKDLVEDLLKNFGVKLYTSNRSAQDLFKYFIQNSYENVDFEPNIETISGYSDEVAPPSQNDYQKEIYKRIYHNLPLLMKSKGTERGLRALINCFGIPSDVLKIRTFGGESSNDALFYAGREAVTGSLGKVRTDNTGSIVEGDTLSQYTNILEPGTYYTEDLHSIEVGFSPTYNINEYIISQSGQYYPYEFNIDDYIGDPRDNNPGEYKFLRDQANRILQGVDTYDLKDFVRLIKFYDNVLFRMVKDFAPARAVVDTGIIIKPHLLERNKIKPIISSGTRPEYTGSLKTGFASGSNGGAYSIGGNDGESSTQYRELIQTPIGKRYYRWEINPSAGGFDEIEYLHDRSSDQAKFDGEFSGSIIEVSNGEWNENNPFKQREYREVQYDVAFFETIPSNICLLTGKGTQANPYILRWEVDRSSTWPMDIFFNFATINGHTYAKGNGSVITNPEGYDFNVEFGGALNEDNYIVENMGCIKDTPAGCVATTYIQKVICSFSKNNQEFPTTGVASGEEFNLYDFFIYPYSEQADVEILVNNVALSEAEAESYEFDFTLGDNIEISIRDRVDNTCRLNEYINMASCGLGASAEAITQDEATFLNPPGTIEMGDNPLSYDVDSNGDITLPVGNSKISEYRLGKIPEGGNNGNLFGLGTFPEASSNISIRILYKKVLNYYRDNDGIDVYEFDETNTYASPSLDFVYNEQILGEMLSRLGDYEDQNNSNQPNPYRYECMTVPTRRNLFLARYLEAFRATSHYQENIGINDENGDSIAFYPQQMYGFELFVENPPAELNCSKVLGPGGQNPGYYTFNNYIPNIATLFSDPNNLKRPVEFVYSSTITGQAFCDANNEDLLSTVTVFVRTHLIPTYLWELQASQPEKIANYILSRDDNNTIGIFQSQLGSAFAAKGSYKNPIGMGTEPRISNTWDSAPGEPPYWYGVYNGPCE